MAGTAAVVCLAAALMAALPQGGPVGSLPEDMWVHEGDSDGDGLRDEFEIRHGLDPRNAKSYPDEVVDETRQVPDGRTLWAVQEAEQAGAAGASDGGGSCGALGAEVLLVLVLAGLRRACERRRSIRGGGQA